MKNRFSKVWFREYAQFTTDFEKQEQELAQNNFLAQSHCHLADVDSDGEIGLND